MRQSFTFYRSFFEAVKQLKKADQATVLLAICSYALDGDDPHLTGVPSAIFTLIQPNLDASKRKAESGKMGGQMASKTEANGKQTESKQQANEKQIPSKIELGVRSKELGVRNTEEEGDTPRTPRRGAVAIFLDRVNPAASQTSLEELAAFETAMGAEVCIRAMDKALDEKKAQWSYIRGILRSYQAQGVKCLADIAALDARHEQTKGKPVSKAPSPTPGVAGEADQRAKQDMERMIKLMEEGKL